MKQDLITKVNMLIDDIKQLLQQKNSSKVRKELSEAYLSLAILNNYFSIEPISKTSIEFIMNKIIHYITYDDYFKYYMSFYYLPQNVFNKNVENLSSCIYQSNINISFFRCLIHASEMLRFSLDTSTNNYFFSRGLKIVESIKKYISYPFDFDISSMVYLVLNYYQALCEYENCSDMAYKDNIPQLKNEYEALFELMYNNVDFSKTIQTNKQLLGFWCSKVPKEFRYDFSLEIMPEVLNIKYLWIMCSCFECNIDNADRVFNGAYERIIQGRVSGIVETALIIRLLSFSLLYKNNTDLSEFEIVDISGDNSNCVRLPLSYFFKNYSNLENQVCSQEDMQILFSFDDAVLRRRVSECMQNVDLNELERQISKPHGSLEISDLDVKFTENGKLKYLCMPFKTGHEITGETMSEKYMYQLLKPFAHFGDNCLVVLITAKKCSQGLETYIQRMSVRNPSWRIEVIQNKQLCKLLKANARL